MESSQDKCVSCPLLEYVCDEIQEAPREELAAALEDFHATLVTECQEGPYFSVGQKRRPFNGAVEIIRCQTPRAAYLDKAHTEKVIDSD